MAVSTERTGVIMNAARHSFAPQNSAASGVIDDAAHAGPYLLTLCSLDAPVTIRAPESPALQKFKFFMSRSPRPDGGQQLHLNMGYFTSLAEAERWAYAVRGRYPDARPTRLPDSMLQRPSSGAPVSAPVISSSPTNAATGIDDIPVENEVLTDTQVLRVLDSRAWHPATAGSNEAHEISLVGPEDTDTRRALKEAVVQGAHVSFAVQLVWSVSDIPLNEIPGLSIFKAYTLYTSSAVREGRTWHCVRLGFFSDAISAKQVACYVRSHFSSAAVVPVTELEQQRAKESPIDAATLFGATQRSNDEPRKSTPPASATPAPAKPAGSSSMNTISAPPAPKPKAKPASSSARRGPTLEETLEMLADSASLSDPESHSETGVRHLKFEVQKGRGR